MITQTDETTLPPVLKKRPAPQVSNSNGNPVMGGGKNLKGSSLMTNKEKNREKELLISNDIEALDVILA